MKQCVHSRRLPGNLSLAVLWFALWAVLAPLTAYPQTNVSNMPRSESSLSVEIQELIQLAIRGDPKAQCDLGMSYLEGKGVDKNLDEAIKWLYKSAEQDPVKHQNNPAQTTPTGMHIEKLITLDGTTFENVTVERAGFDGISITYKAKKGSFGMAKIKFRDLPDDVQKTCGYDPQAETAFMIQQLAVKELGYAMAAKNKGKTSEVVAMLAHILSDYHKQFTYLTNEYDCKSMSCDIWNMVFSKGINARILAGNVQEDITSIAQANHAWVLAEISSGEWLALETTGGYFVSSNQNKRYFYGCKFSTPKEFNHFVQLQQQYNDDLSKWRAAKDSYNNVVTAYNNADKNGRASLQRQVDERTDLLKNRKSDLDEVNTGIAAFHLTGN